MVEGRIERRFAAMLMGADEEGTLATLLTGFDRL
jgi:hypothetical protein